MIKHSDDLGELFKALNVLQSKLTHAPKTADNPFFKSTYSPLPVVLDSTKELMHECGLTLNLMLDKGGNGRVGVTTCLGHISGQYMMCEGDAPLAKDDIQGLVAALTYLHRKCHQITTGQASDDDDDGNGASGNTYKPPVKLSGTAVGSSSFPTARATAQDTSPTHLPPTTGGQPLISEVKLLKEGEGKKGPWKLHLIKLTDGTECTTFEDRAATLAYEMQEEQCPVHMDIEPDSYKPGNFKLVNLWRINADGSDKTSTETAVVDKVTEKQSKQGNRYCIAHCGHRQFGTKDPGSIDTLVNAMANNASPEIQIEYIETVNPTLEIADFKILKADTGAQATFQGDNDNPF